MGLERKDRVEGTGDEGQDDSDRKGRTELKGQERKDRVEGTGEEGKS